MRTRQKKFTELQQEYDRRNRIERKERGERIEGMGRELEQLKAAIKAARRLGVLPSKELLWRKKHLERGMPILKQRLTWEELYGRKVGGG